MFRFEALSRGALTLGVGWVWACSSYEWPEPAPADPQRAEAARAERERLIGEQAAEEAARLELERAVASIEGGAGDAPRPLDSSEVSTLLLYYCGECHSSREYSAAVDGLAGIEDLDEMIEIGKIMPGDGEGSRLVLRVRDGSMPPASSESPPMPARSVERIIAFIDALSAPELAPSE